MSDYPWTQADETPEIDQAANDAGITAEEEKLGVQAIIFLQKLAGIVETEEQARAGWRGMHAWEKESTLYTYYVMILGTGGDQEVKHD